MFKDQKKAGASVARGNISKRKGASFAVCSGLALVLRADAKREHSPC